MQLLFEEVGHAFDGLRVLEGVSLSVAAGETLAILGPSGCGKSTLLAIAGGLLRPARGRVRLRGTPPEGCLNPLTYVFQDFALLPWRTVAGNVALALEATLDRRARRERVAEVLRRTGLSDFAGAYPRQLSGGMKQRVGIARALAVRPAVLLMDEPLSALDAQTRELLLEEFLTLWREARTTTLYVTHNLDEALRIADRICVLSRRPGRIRGLLEVPLPVAERTAPGNAARIGELRAELWRMIAEEVRAADRELASDRVPVDG